MYDSRLIRKEYDLVLKFWKKEIIFKYEEATAYEVLKFIQEMKKENFSLIEWLYDFLNDKTKLSKKEFAKTLTSFENVFTAVQNSYFFNVFNKKKSLRQTRDKMPFNAYICAVSEYCKIDPLTLIKKYTFRQLEYFAEWVVYNLNSKTKEGVKRNRMNSRVKNIKEMWNIDEDLARVEKLKKRMEAKNNTNKK